MNQEIFAPNYVSRPYWWERTPRPQLNQRSLPTSTDVLILGSGYTGLSAAIQTAQHGLQTVILDAEDVGWGCSTRNGGQISTGIKSSYPELVRQYGKDEAAALLEMGKEALRWTENFIAGNDIACDFRRSGRFKGAHSRHAFKAMCQTIRETPETIRDGTYIISPEQQKQEIGSNYYYGGCVNPAYASVDPARYHQGMLNIALHAGCTIIPHCPALTIQKQGGVLNISTPKGTLRARDVIVATNGYTSAATSWMQRRIIPIGSYLIATEPLSKGMMDELLPTDRMITDTLKLVVYYRACPERKRLLFGGRISIKETQPLASAPKLRQLMLDRFPLLSGIRITHSWMGFVGYTFDQLPHSGVHEGVHYCLGYCGSGISLSGYLGGMTGLKVAGQLKSDCPLDKRKFAGRPYYRGNPWFLEPAVLYYRLRDRLAVRSTQRQHKPQHDICKHSCGLD